MLASAPQEQSQGDGAGRSTSARIHSLAGHQCLLTPPLGKVIGAFDCCPAGMEQLSDLKAFARGFAELLVFDPRQERFIPCTGHVVALSP